MGIGPAIHLGSQIPNPRNRKGTENSLANNFQSGKFNSKAIF